MSAKARSSRARPVQVFCNGARPKNSNKNDQNIFLEYRPNQESPQNISLKLSDFIENVIYLPDRVLDLLEIAAYVFCADRHASRGKPENLEYHSWARQFEYFIKVRDAGFWQTPVVLNKLQEALIWMAGDRNHRFNFLSGHQTDKTHLFDSNEHLLENKASPRVVLFSGGLDSLAGIAYLLKKTNDLVWPISHRSNSATVRTQDQLIRSLKQRYPSRIKYSTLTCHLHRFRAPEESQRTRAFLYCSVGLAMAETLKQSDFYIFENGVTALNFPKRGAMLNARASRTAHPKTLRLLQELFCLVLEKPFEIKTPFAFKTKTEVVEEIKRNDLLNLMNSSVSCSKTFKPLGPATHCGECSQCIDRRFAAYAAECDSSDEGGIYAFDFINSSITNGETKTGIIDYLRQARYLHQSNIGNFLATMADQLSDAVDFRVDEQKQVELIHELCKRHGQQVQQALIRMIKPLENYPEGSLKTLLYSTDLSRPPVYELAGVIKTMVEDFIRKAFVKNKPDDENDLNTKIDAFLSGHRERFEREHPSLRFSIARTVPDLSSEKGDLLIEVKFIRGSTSPSTATEGISADLTKYPDEPLKLFIVYDPEQKISNHDKFKRDFEIKRHCIIHIV